jgi:hypothetical protein
MKIDKSNYEIWLIDWLDGNLSDLEVEQLKSFLDENPELWEEFDELAMFRLKPSVKSFPDKNNLKKTTADLSGLQFEYLCVAYLENDLSTDQQTELRESIDLDPEKKRTFELIQRLRLAPASVNYKHKNQLIRKPLVQRVIRLSVIGLSAAAVILLALITYLTIPRKLSDKIIVTAQNVAVDSSLQQPIAEIVTDEVLIEKNLFAGVKKSNSVIPESDLKIPIQNDSLVRNPGDPEIQLDKIHVFAKIDIKGESISSKLVASNSTFNIPSYDDGRSNLSKFIAKTFRGKILKEKTLKDSPLKAYEIAEAGVAGLNTLLGWEMALNERKDENGELRSVYFSSKILKFNAPVKKNQPLK